MLLELSFLLAMSGGEVHMNLYIAGRGDFLRIVELQDSKSFRARQRDYYIGSDFTMKERTQHFVGTRLANGDYVLKFDNGTECSVESFHQTAPPTIRMKCPEFMRPQLMNKADESSIEKYIEEIKKEAHRQHLTREH